ncbi:hypothetical protein JAAARDRAFT_119687 [Jaapia argillacea MUCL 33604]|uniref:Uncharacterized protein n=1 Tax=Jaapia argillacea MUCL 33604 TaxID=933084 RepID=A0A067QL35_9AGAM|nr:hypothetical protein JAAARDRAFT_119687 [Jaapia argillacea MUCL 33604]
MPTTRRQAKVKGAEFATDEVTEVPKKTRRVKAPRKKAGKGKEQTEKEKEIGEKRSVEELQEEGNDEQEQPAKKSKAEEDAKVDHSRLSGVIERGHIYFFYRPKVQIEEAESLDDVRNFHILLVPRPPAFSVEENDGGTNAAGGDEVDERDAMNLIPSGADAVPAKETKDEEKKKFRVITVGKKQLPDPDSGGGGKGRKEVFWATVTSVGDDLHKLEEGLGEKEYKTKTRGTRHEEPARLVGRGAYAIVNNDPSTPSKAETHLGYHLSHPSPSELGQVQTDMRIFSASSFILQVKNPLAPATGRGAPRGKGTEYPQEIMTKVFGKGVRGREKYGLRFASISRPEILDYSGTQLLLIGAREGEVGLEASLGEGRGEALRELEEEESHESIEEVLKELAMDEGKIPAEPLKGSWL